MCLLRPGCFVCRRPSGVTYTDTLHKHSPRHHPRSPQQLPLSAVEAGAHNHGQRDAACLSWCAEAHAWVAAAWRPGLCHVSASVQCAGCVLVRVISPICNAWLVGHLAHRYGLACSKQQHKGSSIDYGCAALECTCSTLLRASKARAATWLCDRVSRPA
jgi:hypothetical protein